MPHMKQEYQETKEEYYFSFRLFSSEWKAKLLYRLSSIQKQAQINQ